MKAPARTSIRSFRSAWCERFSRICVQMSKDLGVDADRRAKWQDICDKISAFPTQERGGKTVFRYSEKGTAWWDGNTLGDLPHFPGRRHRPRQRPEAVGTQPQYDRCNEPLGRLQRVFPIGTRPAPAWVTTPKSFSPDCDANVMHTAFRTCCFTTAAAASKTAGDSSRSMKC